MKKQTHKQTNKQTNTMIERTYNIKKLNKTKKNKQEPREKNNKKFYVKSLE